MRVEDRISEICSNASWLVLLSEEFKGQFMRMNIVIVRHFAFFLCFLELGPGPPSKLE